MRPLHKIALLSAAVAACAAFAADDATADDKAADGGATNETAKADVAADPGFAKYQTIIDRQPFGPPPPDFDPSLPPGKQTAVAGGEEGGRTEAEISAEEQKMMSSVRVSVLNVTPSGAVMVGFTDSTTQPPVNYYLKVGEASTDAAKWLVKDANPSEGTVTLSKDDIDVTLSVGGETKKGAPMAARPAPGGVVVPSNPPPGGGRMFPGRLAPGGVPANGPNPSGADMRGGALARLKERRMMKQAAETAQKQAVETARAEREAKIAAEQARMREQEELDREQRRAEREEQRQALLQIQEELRRQRELRTNRNTNGESDPPQPE